jgi:tRNA pseudouridine13 synthase
MDSGPKAIGRRRTGHDIIPAVIKARPEDFIVEELADLPFAEQGKFAVYRLQKRHWNTTDIVRYLARRHGLAGELFAYGGKKDKHGLTTQYLTIADAVDRSETGRDYRLEACGRMDRPMGPDLIKANVFTIAVRDLSGLAECEEALERIWTEGIPNWFDDQRFRSYDPNRGFFAEKILRCHWNGALQALFTSITPDLEGRERERRLELFRLWRDWKACRTLAEGYLEKSVFDVLRDRPDEFGQALHRLPVEETAMQYSVFQAYLWNELLRRIIRERGLPTVEVPGRAGAYLFWTRIKAQEWADLKTLSLPTAAVKMDFADTGAARLFEEILKERALSRSAFRTQELRRLRFKSFPRAAVIVPDDFQVLERGRDELHPGRKKIVLRFALPRGSYATILVKRLTLPRSSP